ncbi:MAG TPA: tetratricopeptide repeat protein [Candidatus Sulfotelmatobacter sp.]|nr:tetratricopeptide repeat protein [Candidatus Sulfotelmatobacter sp.]
MSKDTGVQSVEAFLEIGALMKVSFIFGSVLLVASVSAFSQTSDDELKLGMAAYKNTQYEQAMHHFEKAVELDPGNINAHLYLATTYVNQYIPGVDTDDNKSVAERGIAHYQKVIDLNAKNDQKINSAKGIAYLYLNMKNWDEARKYYQMASDLDANDPENYYSMGVMDWTQCYQPRMEGRARLGMQPDQHLSAKNPEQKKLCDELLAKNWSVIEDGISNLEKAIQLRPEYDDAMAYVNLMYRERADLECADVGARNRDLKTADDWVDKTLATKRAKAERGRVAQ